MYYRMSKVHSPYVLQTNGIKTLNAVGKTLRQLPKFGEPLEKEKFFTSTALSYEKSTIHAFNTAL